MLKFFRRLQWKLTLSYALVTAGTVIVLTVMMVAIAIYFSSENTSRTYDAFYWSKTGFQDNVPYLLDDPQALQTWLERVQEDGFNRNDFQSTTVRETLDYANTLITKTQPIYVLDPALNILAVAPLDNPGLIGKAFKPRALLDVSMEAALEAAQEGGKNYYGQSVTASDGTLVAAFPLRKNHDDPVTAIVVYRLRPMGFVTPTNMELYQTFFLIMMAVMFILALPVGALFGWVVTRGLRKRLATLSTASKAWSRGDFNAAPQDPAGDEIGELTRNLNGMAEQLEALLHTRDELARVEERNRLARDLHDTVKQQTYAARMQLSAAKNLLATDPQAAGALVDSALQLNRETQQELTLIIDELRPAALQGKGLAQALKEYVERWQKHTGIQVGTSVSGERSLPLEVEEALYRVLQESLANVARHAAAERVEIRLDLALEGVTLSIADNGRGFDVNAVTPGSLGLENMRQRLNAVGGTLKVESTPAAGTTVTADVQLNQPQPSVQVAK